MSKTSLQNSEALQQLLSQKFGHGLVESGIQLGDLAVRVGRDKLAELFRLLKEDAELDFGLLVDITAIDWLDSAEQRFEVVYHFLSLKHLHRVRVKVWLAESDASVPTATTYWKGANFMERETWDMYGINFVGNADQRRLLLYEEFVGHPLRKDYPVQGKQPRIPLRSPEVENTARDMVRPPLVQIGRRNSSGSAGTQRGVNRVLNGGSSI